MDMKLMVVRSFGPHAKGDVVSDPGEITKILACEDACKVVRIRVPATLLQEEPPTSATGKSSKEN